jgi:N utilization substance protein A
LFQIEVSEINDGTIEIKGIAREPGFRTKLAVWTRDEKVDPVGACVGLRGQRVKNIVRELNNEKVDIIRWDSNVKNFVTNALAPAKLKAFEVDESQKRLKITVSADQLSLAIGKSGQNVRLAVKLTGWKIDVKSETMAAEKDEDASASLMRVPGIGPAMAEKLFAQGIKSVAMLAVMETEALSAIPGVGEKTATEWIAEAIRLLNEETNDRQKE